MFHHRSAGLSGNARAQNVNMLSGHHQNENLIHRGSQTKSSGTNNSNNKSSDNILGEKKTARNFAKTPSGKKAPTRRRAFGDISNKKANSGLKKDSSSSKRNQQQTATLRPRSNNLLSADIRNAPTIQSSRFAVLPEHQKTTRSKVANKNKVGHQSSLVRKLPFSISKTQVKSHASSKLEPVPDIERPAGRTWKQQLEYDLKSEDDLASVSSIESIPNLVESLRRSRDIHQKYQEEEEAKEDRLLQEKIQAMMDREQKEAEEGLDSLYDVIDNLEILSDSSHGIDKSEGLQGEEWSIPDFSGFDLDLPDDLSFPL